MTPLTNNEKKNPIVANDNYKLGLKEVVPSLEKGEEKTHYNQQHWVSLPPQKTLFNFFKNNNDRGVGVSIIMVIYLKHLKIVAF
jgi:hypothetical protein